VSRPVEERAVPAAVERFVKQLVVTYKAVLLYPPSSAIPLENASQASALLADLTAALPDVSVSVSKQVLLFGDTRLLPGQATASTFAQELYHRSVAEVHFHAGAAPEALLAFLGEVRRPPDELAAAGGLAWCLREARIDTVSVTEASTSVVEVESGESGPRLDSEWPPDHERIEDLLLTAKDPRSEGHRTLVRVLVDPDIVTSYVASVFRQASGSGHSAPPGTALATMARIIHTLGDEDRTEALRALADATRSLPPGHLRARTAEHVLSMARTDKGVAAFVRQVGLDEVCRALTEGVGEDDVSAEGLARAIRNLAQISLAGRDEVANAAGAAMRGAGLSEPTVSAVLGSAVPARIVSAETGSQGHSSDAIDSVLRLVELATGASGTRAEDTGRGALLEEAHLGFRDSDVIGALVTLAVLDLGTDGFDESMSALEDGLGLLLERGEFEAAAEAADTLLDAARSAGPHERDRVMAAVRRLAGEREMRALYRAMHVYERDSSEYLACRQLLMTLGTLAIEPLLEMLADEPDRSLRKSMVELISSLAEHHVGEIGEQINDGRWYFVRNVVSILGATKRRESVPFLGRTLRHADARVRRESIRALAATPDPRVPELLVAALNDADDGNVQLAARYLGNLRYEGAVAALSRVARGEGDGNREHGPRAEAIEALGAIGSPEALPALESIAGRRRLVGGLRAKGLAAVAAAAIDAIEACREAGR
jgi:DNA-binding transcriptional ArsR family regulator